MELPWFHLCLWLDTLHLCCHARTNTVLLKDDIYNGVLLLYVHQMVIMDVLPQFDSSKS